MSFQEGYTQKIENLIKEFKEEIDKLKSKSAEASAETTAENTRIISNLESKQQQAENRLVDFKKAGEESREGIKVEFERIREDIRKSLEHAKTIIQ